MHGMLRRTTLVAALLGVWLVAMVFIALAPAHATEQEPHKAFVCKYVGTPDVDERLQTGQNPIDVDFHAIDQDPVTVGAYFSDAQGRSFVLAIDVGQDEPDASECPGFVPETTTTTIEVPDDTTTTLPPIVTTTTSAPASHPVTTTTAGLVTPAPVPSGPVAVTETPTSGTLPFTGANEVYLAIIGLLVIANGVTLMALGKMRKGRA